MTTRLQKPIKRVAFAPRWGELIVTLAPEGLLLREKGRRTSYGPLPWGKLYQLGAEQRANELRAERRARRKAGRKT